MRPPKRTLEVGEQNRKIPDCNRTNGANQDHEERNVMGVEERGLDRRMLLLERAGRKHVGGWMKGTSR